MQYSWKIADNSDYPSLYKCVEPLGWNVDYITRCIVIPLSIGHLVTFHDDKGQIAGFLTLAFLSKEAESHQAIHGILPGDWKSGPHFWVVDLVAPHGGGDQMLRTILKQVDRGVVAKARYFRIKYKQVREVRV